MAINVKRDIQTQASVVSNCHFPSIIHNVALRKKIKKASGPSEPQELQAGSRVQLMAIGTSQA